MEMSPETAVGAGMPNARTPQRIGLGRPVNVGNYGCAAHRALSANWQNAEARCKSGRRRPSERPGGGIAVSPHFIRDDEFIPHEASSGELRDLFKVTEKRLPLRNFPCRFGDPQEERRMHGRKQLAIARKSHRLAAHR